MTSKSKKSFSISSLWYTCDNCSCFISHKDLQEHQLNYCKELRSSNSINCFNWQQSFVHNLTLYGFMEDCKSTDTSTFVTKDLVLVSQSIMQLCQFVVGDPVIVISKLGDGNCTDKRNPSTHCEVKTIWPTSEGSVTSVFSPKQGMDMSWGLNYGPVKLMKLKSTPLPAMEILFHFTRSTDVPEKIDNFLSILQYQMIGRIFHANSRIAIDFYGKKLKIEILKIQTSTKNDDCVDNLIKDMNEKMNTHGASELNIKISNEGSYSIQFYLVHECTVWRHRKDTGGVMDSDSKHSDHYKLNLNDIGGYKDIIDDLNCIMNECLKKSDSVCRYKTVGMTKGVLLYGLHGVGKTVIAHALANSCSVHVVTVQSGDLFSKFYGETEARLKSLFEEASANAPAVMILDDIDTICPKRGGSDQERRVVATLLTLLDSLDCRNVFVLATTSQLDAIDSALRRPGRLDREIELPVPSMTDREDILKKFLKQSQALVDEDVIKRIAAVAHGYVGADLSAVVAQAYAQAAKSGGNIITASILEWALSQVKPSAMREVLIRVPDVRWSDIGGQDRLKLQLRQAVEWPLNHPDAFKRLGITPPRGILMFGPPGCSKTMIAKALATESKLNFISIKGPELFSKWVGESERAVRAVFKRARSVAPSIVFLDELDAVAGERGGTSSADGGGGSASVQERVLAQLLTELDGVEPLRNVIIIAATNRPDRIDKALLRPGRLDRLIYVPLPHLATRCQILRLQFCKIPVSSDISIDELAGLMEGYSGAEIVAVCHEAALNALEEDTSADVVKRCHFEYALNIVTPRTPYSLLELYDKYITR